MTITRAELRESVERSVVDLPLAPPAAEVLRIAVELGWLAVAVPEASGGLGMTADCEAAIHYELGRRLASAPLLSVLPVTAALAEWPEWVEGVFEGRVATTALDPGGVEQSDAIRAVLAADLATHVLIAEGGTLSLLPIDAAIGSVVPRETWDLGIGLAEIRIDDCAREDRVELARGDGAVRLTMELHRRILIAIAAAALGGARAALELTVSYLATRRQFDRPLGMFQALKHRCADMRIAVEAGEALLWDRCSAPSGTADSGSVKALATDVFKYVTEEAVQLHGGIGLTEEHPIHLYLKRAHLLAALFGTSDRLHEERGRSLFAAI